MLCTPVIRGLKKRHPKSEIHFLTKSQYSQLLEGNPYIDKVLSLDESLLKTVDAIKAEEYDVIIDLHNNLRTHIIKFLTGIKTYKFDKLNFKKWLITCFKINRLPDLHIVDRYMDTADKIGIHKDKGGLDFFINKNSKAHINLKFKPKENIELCFCIGGQHETKKLPINKIFNICSHVGYRVYLIGGPEDKAVGASIEKDCSNVINTCGELSIMESAALIERTDILITHDTGMMHIGAALKTKIVSIWGNTIPQFGMYPYLPNNRHRFSIIENKNLDCRPCSKIGHDSCPKGHFSCMESVDSIHVKNEIEKLLNKS